MSSQFHSVGRRARGRLDFKENVEMSLRREVSKACSILNYQFIIVMISKNISLILANCISDIFHYIFEIFKWRKEKKNEKVKEEKDLLFFSLAFFLSEKKMPKNHLFSQFFFLFSSNLNSKTPTHLDFSSTKKFQDICFFSSLLFLSLKIKTPKHGVSETKWLIYINQKFND